MALNDQIHSLVQEKIAGTENFLVEVKVSPSKVIVLIDHPQGIKIEDCVAVSRFLQEKLDTTDVFEKHELEVGSPGMEEPLKVLQQYIKRLGKNVAVTTFDGMRHTGILLSADANNIQLEETLIVKTGKKKEKQIQNSSIPFTNIKETKVIFSFNKII
ncbi:MAG: ribosome assembly cofactor RimP [Bacteroidetes bacterium]|nr:ribosome assembly cofactor RimP [Bacteroidota bacterium]